MNWVIFVLMLPHLKPKCLKYLWPELAIAFDLARVISLLVVAGLFIWKKKIPSPIAWVLGVLEAWICGVALLTHGDYVQTCSLAVSVVGIVLLVDFYGDRMRELLTALMLNFEWAVYANLATVLMAPDLGIAQDLEYGNMPIYFFGPDNWFMYLCIPAVCVALLYLRLQIAQGWKVDGICRAVYLIIASYACVFIQKPATAMVALAVMAVVVLMGLIPGIRCAVVFPVALVGGVAANLAIAWFRVMETIPWIANLIENDLHKSLTLSGRTDVWDGFLELIQGHLWMGIGTPRGGYLIQDRYFDHMHNQPMDLLIQGGIPALLLFLCALLLIGKNMTMGWKTPSARILTAMLSGLFIICISEVCRHGLIFLLFPLAYHVAQIEAACPHKPLSVVSEDG